MWQTLVRREGGVATARAGTAPSTLEPAPAAPAPGPWDWRFPVATFLSVAGAVVVISVLAHHFLPVLHHRHRQVQGTGWLYAFSWWDGWWYVGIAHHGYQFFRGSQRQSPVAFFPLYPLLMRAIGRRAGGYLLAGFLLTVVSGLGAAVVFHRWCVEKFGPEKARLAVYLLLLYPFAFYLMGAVYADALFLLAALGAFLALEHDQPVLAGLAGAVATSARPVGGAVVAGLWVLYLERRGVIGRLRLVTGDGHRLRWAEVRGRARRADLGLLLAPLGLAAYCTFLWIRFSRPFAFLDTAGAPGWDQPPGFHTWLKVNFVKAMVHGPWSNGHFGHLTINFLATVVVAAFIPAVFRKLGLGYGVFAVLAVLATALSTKDFVGMGRYCLAAFPCFAVAADALAARPWLARGALVCCGAGLVVLAELHARGSILS